MTAGSGRGHPTEGTRSRLKYAWIVGSIALVVNTLVSAGMGICGPLVSLLAGVAAGFLSARREPGRTQGRTARRGAVAGMLSGFLAFIGQLVGGVLVLALFRSFGFPSSVLAPLPVSDQVATGAYFLGGVLVSICFGSVGLVLATAAGAAAASFASRAQPANLEQP